MFSAGDPVRKQAAAIPSDSTGNSTEQDVQEQVGRQGTTNHVRGRFSNETTDQRERRLQANRERNRRRRQLLVIPPPPNQ